MVKTVFQVHGVDAVGAVVIRRSLRRAQVLAFFAKLLRSLMGETWEKKTWPNVTC